MYPVPGALISLNTKQGNPIPRNCELRGLILDRSVHENAKRKDCVQKEYQVPTANKRNKMILDPAY
ncbi:hypothetical protein CHS0354_019284 [Potamilus streckersoni]|uniref:Uncharacterized protein n=1 Tax=Potamilus streckersoni TaxID=2493646 RepID=A0AAE0SHZ3_9BIVA|nr:hypothetical protein CHS0354_019284 [Potamilus streckersoni]